MRDFVRISKEAGLEVYLDPWGVGRVFGGEAFSKFVADRPETCQVLSSGRPAWAACPNHEAFRKWMIEWTDEACALGPDVIFWDEPHFFVDNRRTFADPSAYEEWACRCQGCQELFRTRYAHPMGKVLTPEVAEFRQSSLISFLDALCARVQAHGLRSAVCLVPSPWKKFSRILGIEDWDKAASLKAVDILSTDPYWALFNAPLESFVASFSKRVTDLAKEFGKESEIWIQAFKIQKGRESEVLKAIQTAASYKPSRMAVWSHQATACMSELACQNPELVWKMVREGFQT